MFVFFWKKKHFVFMIYVLLIKVSEKHFCLKAKIRFEFVSRASNAMNHLKKSDKPASFGLRELC